MCETTYLLRTSVLMSIFPGGPWLAGSKLAAFWILLKLRMMEMVVTAGAIRYAQLQSNRVTSHTLYFKINTFGNLNYADADVE